MQGEIVTTTTDDYLRLHGFYSRSALPLRTSTQIGSVDAAILVHGLGGNFFASRLLMHAAQTLIDLGISVVLVNTRGYEMINTSAWAGRSQSVGSAFENIDDCRHDLRGWADFLVQRGHKNLLLLGHSLGAIKSLYTQAYAPHENIRALIGLSATRLSYRSLIDQSIGKSFREAIERCESLIENGSGSDPIQVQYPFPTWMTPQCYIDKYGPAERYNWLQFIDKVTIPTLLLFGSKELAEHPAFDGIDEKLADLDQQWNTITVERIPDADHFYTSKFDELDDQITRWLAG